MQKSPSAVPRLGKIEILSELRVSAVISFCIPQTHAEQRRY